MKKSYEALVKELDANIPIDVISNRKQGGVQLSYLEGWYVIDRLNQVLGQGNWEYKVKDLRVTTDEEIERNGRTGRAVSYLATVELQVKILPDSKEGFARITTFSDVGSGSSIDYQLGGLSAHEGAAKEAVTDALKRAAKNLGRSMGLALYDKTQEFVDDGEEDEVVSTSKRNGTSSTKSKRKPVTKDKGKSPVQAASESSVEEEASNASREETLKLITKFAAVANAKGEMSFKDIKAHMSKKYGTDKKEDLDDAQAKELFSFLVDLVNEEEKEAS